MRLGLKSLGTTARGRGDGLVLGDLAGLNRHELVPHHLSHDPRDPAVVLVLTCSAQQR